MRLDYRSSSLVIAGGWNPNAITPYWFDRNFHDTIFLAPIDPNRPDQQKLNFNIHFTNVYSISKSPITINLIGMKINYGGNRLDLILTDGNDFTLLEKCASILCDRLPNTPVTEYGVNFSFVEETHIQKIIDMMSSGEISKHEDFGTSLSVEKYEFSVKINNVNVNININIDYIQKRCFFNFNFHYRINNLSEFIKNISEHPIPSPIILVLIQVACSE